MAKSQRQIERREQLTNCVVEQVFALTAAKQAVADAEMALARTKAELARLDEIEGRDA